MARWFRDPLLSAVQLHGASCDRRARFDERASGGGRSMPATDLHFPSRKSGKFVTCVCERGRRVRRARTPIVRGAECRPPCRRRRAATAVRHTQSLYHTDTTHYMTLKPSIPTAYTSHVNASSVLSTISPRSEK